jgi:hypothetical protein
MLKLPALTRNCGATTFMVEPWGFTPEVPVPDNVRKDKNIRTKWANAHDTKHCFFMGFEGINAGLRVSKSKDNPVAKMLAMVADYDRPSMNYDQAIEQVLSYEKLPFPPNYISQTLSGGIRLVWVLEVPMNMNTDMAKLMQRHLRKELHLGNLLPGLDEGAVKDPSKYYEVGENWKQLSSDPLPEPMCFSWAMHAFRKVKLSTELEASVPMDRVQSALEEKYPDVTFPKLELGIRMHVFWVPGAVNQSSAFLMEGGFYCHSTDEGFMSWRDLLGSGFMREFEVESTGEVIGKFWYDGQKYISRNPIKEGDWMVQNTSDASLNIAGTFGLLKSPPKKGELSPIERVLHQIQLQKGVKGAASFVHFPAGEITSQGKTFINISTVKAMSPSGQSGEWGEHFPWLAEFFDNFFVDAHQKSIMLAWWKRFYEGALNEKPAKGQVMIVAGPVECGKTLFNTYMLAPSVGGGVDASDYYIDGDDYGATYFEYGLHMVDDGEPGRRAEAQKATAARFKKTAASKTFLANQKYEKKVQVEWNGRVCATMNNDTESLKAMPELQETLRDKIIILRANEPSGQFKGMEAPEIEGMIASELPHLLQWLLDWPIPDTVKSDSRYGVVSYCDNQIKRDVEAGNPDSVFLELLDTFFDEVKAEDARVEKITMRATDLISRMVDCELIKSQMHKFTNAVYVGNILSRMEKRGCGVYHRRSSKGTLWHIEMDYRTKEEV